MKNYKLIISYSLKNNFLVIKTSILQLYILKLNKNINENNTKNF